MTRRKPPLASPIAAEDLRRGLYVTVLNVIDQYFPCCFDLPRRTDPVNIRMLPGEEAQPLRVVGVCPAVSLCDCSDRPGPPGESMRGPPGSVRNPVEGLAPLVGVPERCGRASLQSFIRIKG